MHLKLEPNRGAKPLMFGMKRSDVHSQFEHPYFTKVNEPENEFYDRDGLILGYDDENRLEFIEIIPPSFAEFSDIQFFSLSLDEVLRQMSKLGFSSEYEDGGYNFEAIGIALYCPHKKLESVSVYREGYYDDL